jgi:competence protein ComEC
MPATNSTSGAWSNSSAVFLRWIERHRLPCLAFSCCCAVFTVDAASPAWGVLWALLIGSLFFASRRFAIAGAMLTLLCAGLHHYRCKELESQRDGIGGGVWMDFRAKIIEAPKAGQQSWQCKAAVVHCQPQSGTGKTIIVAGTGNVPALGQVIQAKGYWEPIAGPRNEGEFNRSAHMKRHGIVAECLLRDWQLHAPASGFWRATAAARDGFQRSITQGLDPRSDEVKVILAMVMGQQPLSQDPVLDPFRQTGTLHLFSVSGQHVNLVAMILWLVLQRCRVSRRSAILLLIPAIFGYAWLTGASPPALRAAWMAAVFLSAFLLQRRADLMQALAVVAIVGLLLDSNLLFLAGVQLSYGIVAVISIGLSLCQKPVEKLAWNDSYLPRELYSPWQIRCGESWQKLLQSLVISTSACIGSAPLTIRYFSMVTPVSIITNIALTPLVACLLGLALFSAGISTVSTPLSIASNRINHWVARSCIHCSAFFSKVPGGHAMVSQHTPKHDAIRIYDLPRGGAAVLVQCREADVLLDCGNERAFRSIVFPSLPYFGSQPDCLLLSHPEAAHIGGGILATQHLPLRQIISPVPTAKTPSFRSLQKTASAKNIPLYCARSTARLPQSRDVFWEILQTPEPHDPREIADNRCAIYLLHFHGYRILFLNDAGAVAVSQLLAHAPDLRCDVIVIGRHSLHPPGIHDLLEQTQTKAVIATHADFPESERIPSRWDREFEFSGIPLFHQGRTGMVSLLLQEDQSLSIRGFLDGSYRLPPARK